MTSAVRRLWRFHVEADTRLVGLFYGVLAAKIALLVVLLHVHPDALISPDTSTYVEPAWSLLHEGTFSRAGTPEILRTPGYPLFLLPFLAIFGDGYVPFVIVAHFLLVGVTAVLACGIARRVAPDQMSGDRIAGFAFALVLLAPSLLLSEYNVGTEVLFTFLLTLGVYWLVGFVQEEEVSPLLLGVLALTAAAFVRPIGLYLPYLLAAVGCGWLAMRRRWRAVLAVWLAAILHLGLTGAWSVRNEARVGQRLFTTISHVNLFEYYGAAVKARAEGRSWAETRPEFQRIRERWEGTDAEKAVMAADSGLAVLREYPVQTAIVGFRGLATTVLDPGTGGVANMLKLREPDSGIIYKFVSMDPWSFGVYLLRNEKPLVACLGVGFLWLVFMWGTACWGVLQTKVGPPKVLLLLVVAYVVVLGSGPQSMARFRVPAVPLILVFSAIGAALARGRLKESRAPHGE